ncbi:MAG: aldehyde dehydrogenase family protein, partial [Chloroflexota bacterium]|nr:aldehyde dehydrogenase family protein [Chloroflexota bacterium]
MVIGGRFIGTAGLERLSIDNPADGRTIGEVPIATEALIDQAVEAAYTAFGPWAALPASKRGEHLLSIADWLVTHQDDLSRLLTLEQGKPRSEARSEVAQAAKTFRYYAAEAVRIRGETIPAEARTLRSLVVRQPMGVVAAIAPWNYPLGIMCWKVAPA